MYATMCILRANALRMIAKKKKMLKVFVNVYLFMTLREKQSILEQIHVLIGEASPAEIFFHLKTRTLMTV